MNQHRGQRCVMEALDQDDVSDWLHHREQRFQLDTIRGQSDHRLIGKHPADGVRTRLAIERGVFPRVIDGRRMVARMLQDAAAARLNSPSALSDIGPRRAPACVGAKLCSHWHVNEIRHYVVREEPQRLGCLLVRQVPPLKGPHEVVSPALLDVSLHVLAN